MQTASLQTDNSSAPKRITLLGSTGTIGQNTLKLVELHPNKFTIETLTARKNSERLIEQARKFKPRRVAIEDESRYDAVKHALRDEQIDVISGKEGIIDVAAADTDIVVSGIVGAAALAPTLRAIEQGHTIALANKECLVCAGDVVMQTAEKHQATIIPVDSEHNAIFQAIQQGAEKEITKITLTASGGPFRNTPVEELAHVTIEQAVNHPNWDMGAKISVDSATMMNKGLELIEAYHLFPVEASQLDAIIHPQSIIHGLVHYTDGSVIAGMSEPDMCAPIAYALGYPNRIKSSVKPLDLATIGRLDFEAPDVKRFPALSLALSALKTGKTAPSILNAANEIAVEAFLQKRIGFMDIVSIVENVLEHMEIVEATEIDAILAADTEARRMTTECIELL